MLMSGRENDLRASQSGLAEAVRRTASWAPRRPALIFEDRTWTYTELVSAMEDAAGALVALGVGPGDRVAALARNSDRYVIAWLATQLLGAVHVPVNFMLGAREITYILEHSGACVVLCDEHLLPVLTTAVTGLDHAPTVAVLDGSAAGAALDFLSIEPARPIDEPSIAADVVAQIAYTSGTEAAPKGAMLSHGGLMSQYLSCIVAGEYQRTDRVLHALPLYHCAQMHCFLMPSLVVGATSVILSAPTPAAVVDAIAEHAITSFFAPPTVWIGLLHHPSFGGSDVATLRKAYYGASIMPVQTVRDLTERVPDLRLWNYYGQTELGPMATVLQPEDQLRKPGSAGQPILGVQTRVVDDDLTDVPVGGVGEVVHRSPHVMSGYFEDPTRTAEAFAGGWFHSGDLATVDEDGYITIVDRKKDMINTGGENVSSREVEETLYEHPDVVEVAVVARSDEKWGEAVHAFVVPRDGSEATPESLRAFARERLAGYKVPKDIDFCGALPKNPSGKILKRELRDRWGATDGSTL